ncbi:MAG: DUF3795 domain-containing protein [Candidatus Ratteibacteria bacterium]|jgi:hypothetical protein
MKDENKGLCGFDCNACDVLKSTVHGDAEALQRAHKLWTKTARQHWGMQTLDSAILKCTGCRVEDANIFKGCQLCPIRSCAKGKNLPSCGLCLEWQKCERLSGILADFPEVRNNLERIEASSNR